MERSEAGGVTPPARRLRWELTRSYALVTMAGTLLAGLALVGAGVLLAPTVEWEPGTTPEAWLAAAGLAAVGAAAFALGAGACFGYLTARGIVRRLDAITVAAGAWSDGDFDALAEVPGGDELALLARRLNAMAGRMRELVRVEQAAAAAAERERLARDLHDAVKQQAFGLSLQVAAARARLNPGDAEVDRRLAEAERLAHAVAAELDAIVRQLRPSVLEREGLVAALRAFAAAWSAQHGIATTVRPVGEGPLPLPVAYGLLRVGQEALANTARHSGASAVVVTVLLGPGGATLEVADDGVGLAAGTAGGFGIEGMRERMAALGGRLRVESAPGGGTRVVADWVPPLRPTPNATAVGSTPVG